MGIQKVAIVTGAGQGIGLAVALKFASEGVKVVLNDLDADLCSTACKSINNTYPNMALAVAGNSAEVSVIDSLIFEAVKNFGRLDIVVANSGITRFGDFLTFSEKDFEDVSEVNLKGTFFLCQKAAIQLINQGGGGSIVLMSSVVGHLAHKNLAAYAMTKAAIEMLAKNLVVELSKYKIRVNTVAPGATLTERTLEDQAYHHTWSQITPLGIPAEVNDIAEAVCFFSSDAAKHITGQSLVVDGGWTSVGIQPD